MDAGLPGHSGGAAREHGVLDRTRPGEGEHCLQTRPSAGTKFTRFFRHVSAHIFVLYVDSRPSLTPFFYLTIDTLSEMRPLNRRPLRLGVISGRCL